MSSADPWITFSRSASFDPRVVEVKIGTLNAGQGYWLKRIVTANETASVNWTDTIRCPLARSVLTEVRKLEFPRVSVPWLESDEIMIAADGVNYLLTGYAEYPDATPYPFEIQSNSQTPLARWVDDSLQTLESCWADEPFDE